MRSAPDLSAVGSRFHWDSLWHSMRLKLLHAWRRAICRRFVGNERESLQCLAEFVRLRSQDQFSANRRVRNYTLNLGEIGLSPRLAGHDVRYKSRGNLEFESL